MESVRGPACGTHRPRPQPTQLERAEERRLARPVPKEPGRARSTARMAATETQASKDAVGDTLPPRAQVEGVASGWTEAPSLNSQDPRTT